MKKIKILRVITRLNVGGPAIHAIILNKGLNSNMFDSHLVIGTVSEGEGDMTFLAKENGIPMTVIPELGRKINWQADLVAFWKLFKIINRERPHIVHTHTAKAGALGRLAAILAGAPIKIHTFHGHVFHSYFNANMAKMFILAEKIFAKFTDHIIVVSNAVGDEICNRFKITDYRRASVIELGLDLDRFKNIAQMKGSLRRELAIDEKTLLVGIAGRLTHIKNHRLLFDAAKLLKEEMSYPKVKFLIIGDGELKTSLEKYVFRLGIKDSVSFIGWRKDMPRIYADLDVVALTSLNEGTPVSLIEAMASQRAIVATRVGGIPDLISDKETGLLVDSDNPRQLKQALVTLLKDSELRNRLGEEASRYVYDRYSKNRLIKDVEDLYTRLLIKKRII